MQPSAHPAPKPQPKKVHLPTTSISNWTDLGAYLTGTISDLFTSLKVAVLLPFLLIEIIVCAVAKLFVTQESAPETAADNVTSPTPSKTPPPVQIVLPTERICSDDAAMNRNGAIFVIVVALTVALALGVGLALAPAN